MKSIKENAKEYENNIGSQDYCYLDIYDSYEAGANYVLSVLYEATYKEDWITNPKDGIRRFFEIYKQLKK